MSTSASPSKVRLGFVGVGGMGQCAHLKYYATTPGCEVAAIAEIRPQLAAKVARKYMIDKIYASHEEMIQKEKLDGLVAIQQFGHHGSLLPSLYQANIPVITEKPLANSVETGQMLLNKLGATSSKHFVAYHKRSDLGTLEALKIIKQWQASGEFGKLRAVRASMAGGDWIANGFYDLITTPEQATGLVADARAPHTTEAWHGKYVTMVNFYIHQINLIRMLVNNDYKVTYGDKTGRLMVGHTPEDALVTLEMNYYSPTAWSESFLVTFDKAWLRLDFPAPVTVNQSAQLTVYRSAGKDSLATTTQVGIPWQSAMANQAAQYVNAIRGGQTTLETAQDAIKDLVIARDLVNAIEAAQK